MELCVGPNRKAMEGSQASYHTHVPQLMTTAVLDGDFGCNSLCIATGLYSCNLGAWWQQVSQPFLAHHWNDWEIHILQAKDEIYGLWCNPSGLPALHHYLRNLRVEICHLHRRHALTIQIYSLGAAMKVDSGTTFSFSLTCSETSRMGFPIRLKRMGSRYQGKDIVNKHQSRILREGCHERK